MRCSNFSHVNWQIETKKTITTASRTLSPTECKYAHTEKEPLALIFGVRWFHQYLYGRKFTLATDHKPLLAILQPKEEIPSLAAARLQHWTALLSAYMYMYLHDIEFKWTHDHCNAVWTLLLTTERWRKWISLPNQALSTLLKSTIQEEVMVRNFILVLLGFLELSLNSWHP